MATMRNRHIDGNMHPSPIINLPSELFLQILENISDIGYLWATVRLVSKSFKIHTERVFQSSHLPTLSISLSLPRYDPATGTLRYRGYVPQTEVTLRYASLDQGNRRVVMATSTMAPNGESMADLKAAGVLSVQRLEEATIWVWFGRNRGKGVGMENLGNIRWDDEQKIWFWGVEWKKLVKAYFEAKGSKRRSQRNLVRRARHGGP
ncbi:hypothetical protein BU26DRAFT_525672 [Trematosphaeria pertusa]|uniref:F-box domain-containing protein n=1 Tax=Trematosphaeria pertusa TaxID=390896 RepID=A0A6A6HRY4_9PLEO|nr:uncharacterized protein BU26DRAFT_525672 [Trematosphaeria pertusa]KAF2240761.1 hypothetical protein BU26DRAFT_525672 [Trematosphaeria pertusa]